MKNMIRLLHSKSVIGGGCLVLAAVLAFGLLPRLYKSKASTIQVVTPRVTVERGTEISENLLTVIDVVADGLPSSIVTNKKDIIGLVADATLYGGEYLLRERFVAAENYQNAALYPAPEDGKCLLTIKFPGSSAGIAGVIRGSSIVDVYSVTETEEGSGTAKVIEGLQVYKVLNAKLQPLDELGTLAKKSETGSTDFDFAPAYVVVKADEQQAKILIGLEKSESLHLTFVKAGVQ